MSPTTPKKKKSPPTGSTGQRSVGLRGETFLSKSPIREKQLDQMYQKVDDEMDDESDMAEVVSCNNLRIVTPGQSPTKKPSPASKEKTTAVKHISISKKAETSSSKNIGRTLEDSDSDIEVMSPTIPKKKKSPLTGSPEHRSIGLRVATFLSKSPIPEKQLAQIHQIVDKHTSLVEEKEIGKKFINPEEDNSWGEVPLNEVGARNKAGYFSMEQSLGSPSHYSSSDTVSPQDRNSPPISQHKPGPETENLAAKRRLFNSISPHKFQPKKARNFKTNFLSKSVEDDDLICLD